MEILVEDRCRRIEEWRAVSPRKHLCPVQSKIERNKWTKSSISEPTTSGRLATRSLVPISRIITSGFRVETAPRSYRRSVLTVRPPTPCKWIEALPRRWKCSAARASKFHLGSELSRRTNEWPKIRTVGGELVIEKTTNKLLYSNQWSVNWTTHTRKQTLRNKPDRNQNKEPNRTLSKARDLQEKRPLQES